LGWVRFSTYFPEYQSQTNFNFDFQLYHYYGFRESDIAVLYVAGFAASLLFGTATGPLADLIGRRKIAQGRTL
jgi:MFS family permease